MYTHWSDVKHISMSCSISPFLTMVLSIFLKNKPPITPSRLTIT